MEGLPDPRTDGDLVFRALHLGTPELCFDTCKAAPAGANELYLVKGTPDNPGKIRKADTDQHVEVLSCLFAAFLEHGPSLGALRQGIYQLDSFHSSGLSRCSKKVDRLDWTKHEADKLKQMMSYVRERERRNPGKAKSPSMLRLKSMIEHVREPPASATREEAASGRKGRTLARHLSLISVASSAGAAGAPPAPDGLPEVVAAAMRSAADDNDPVAPAQQWRLAKVLKRPASASAAAGADAPVDDAGGDAASAAGDQASLLGE